MRLPVRAAWVDFAEALLVAVLLATFARTFVVQVFRIPTESMADNLLVGDHLFVNKLVYGPVAWKLERRLLPIRDPARGDVVVFRFPVDPERDFVKRAVAGPGARVKIHRKRLILDGEITDEPYATFADPSIYPDSPFLDEYYRYRDNFGPLIVPPDHFFVLGDNRDLSNDSRFWGPVPRRYLQGQAVLISFSLAPLDGDRELGWWQRPFAALGRVRWSRVLEPVR